MARAPRCSPGRSRPRRCRDRRCAASGAPGASIATALGGPATAVCRSSGSSLAAGPRRDPRAARARSPRRPRPLPAAAGDVPAGRRPDAAAEGAAARRAMADATACTSSSARGWWSCSCAHWGTSSSRRRWRSPSPDRRSPPAASCSMSSRPAGHPSAAHPRDAWDAASPVAHDRGPVPRRRRPPRRDGRGPARPDLRRRDDPRGRRRGRGRRGRIRAGGGRPRWRGRHGAAGTAGWVARTGSGRWAPRRPTTDLLLFVEADTYWSRSRSASSWSSWSAGGSSSCPAWHGSEPRRASGASCPGFAMLLFGFVPGWLDGADRVGGPRALATAFGPLVLVRREAYRRGRRPAAARRRQSADRGLARASPAPVVASGSSMPPTSAHRHTAVAGRVVGTWRRAMLPAVGGSLALAVLDDRCSRSLAFVVPMVLPVRRVVRAPRPGLLVASCVPLVPARLAPARRSCSPSASRR